MQFSFRRYEKYPGLDLECQVRSHTSSSGGVRHRIFLRAEGPLDQREALLQDFAAWLKKGRLRPKSQRFGETDTHETLLRGWAHTLEFLVFWLGEATLGQMLHDANSLSFKHHIDLFLIRKELVALKESIAIQNRYFQAAAAALAAKP